MSPRRPRWCWARRCGRLGCSPGVPCDPSRPVHIRPPKKGKRMHLTLLEPGGLLALAQVLMIDIVLAGDNAVVIGMAAARVPEALRNKVILWGLAAAVVLRVGLAVMAVSLMEVIGLTL